MADFASINHSSGNVWINLDHVRKIEVGSDPKDPTHVRLTNGEVITLSHEEGMKLVQQVERLRALKMSGAPTDSS